MAFANQLPKRTEDLSDWYVSVIEQAKLADYGPVKGTMIIMPRGYALWENIMSFMDHLIKDKGVQNGYFPLLIPETFLHREKQHVAGFAPECAYVTVGGGEELTERLVIRPTSETIMYESYAKWIQSHRDLPMLINQWNNVLRWEKRTIPFLRTSEFLWQEGHCAHATSEENWEMVLWAIRLYEKTYNELLAIPGVVGKKSESEKFAGANATLTFESLMPSGKSLQSCTSHDLGQNFSKTFNVAFQDQDGQKKYVWQNSWGYSTRSIGALILMHGDDKGLVLPPHVAPVQVVIVPIKNDPQLLAKSEELKNKLSSNFRVKIDSDFTKSLGYRLHQIELEGYPLRLEIGQKEAESDVFTLVKRNTGEKLSISTTDLQTKLLFLLNQIHEEMYAKAKKYQDDNTRFASNYDEFKEIMQNHRGFIKVFWNQTAESEAKIKEETKATSRCQPLDQETTEGKDFLTGEPCSTTWLFAQSY